MSGGFFVAPSIFIIEVASAVARETRVPNNPQADARKAVNQIYTLPIMRLLPVVQNRRGGMVLLVNSAN